MIVICIDTLRADHVGAYGYHRRTTPFVDQLADEGVRFTRAWAPSSWTVPSVASLMTSRLPEEHGAGVPGEVKHLGDSSPPRQIADGIPMLAEIMSTSGFRTALFSANPFLYGRFRDGFDVALVQRMDAASLTDAALEWLGAHSGGRRFLYIQYMDVHQPNEPPEPYFSMFPGEEGGDRDRRHADWSFGRQRDLEDPAFREFRAHRIATYDGAIRFVDDQIERLISSTREKSSPGSTLVIVTSDHGEEFWDHALEQAGWGDDPRGLWGIGHGHTLYDELLRVPLVVSGAQFPQGVANDCDASLLDVLPTVLRATGVVVPDGSRGRDLAALGGPEGGRCRRPLLAGELAYGPSSSSLRLGDMKLSVRGTEIVQLFHTRHDPREVDDLSSANPELVARMQRQMAALQSSLALAPPGPAPPFHAELREQLRALGYL